MLNLETGEYLGSLRRKYNAQGVLISEVEYHQKVFEGWHYHKNNHLTLILSGGNKEQRKNAEICANPGEVLIYKSGELHRNINTLHPSSNVNIEIEDSFFAKYSLDTSVFKDLTCGQPKLKLSTLQVYRECLSNDAQTTISIHAILLNLFSSRVFGKMHQPPWIAQVKEIIHDRWTEKLSLRVLSEAAGVHPVTISKGFPKYFASTLGDYIRQVRIEKSICLIKQTKIPLTEIAQKCGFADQSHFIRSFKANTGFLPKDFRRL